MKRLLDLELPERGFPLQQLIQDCATTLKYQVKTGKASDLCQFFAKYQLRNPLGASVVCRHLTFIDPGVSSRRSLPPPISCQIIHGPMPSHTSLSDFRLHLYIETKTNKFSMQNCLKMYILKFCQIWVKYNRWKWLLNTFENESNFIILHNSTYTTFERMLSMHICTYIVLWFFFKIYIQYIFKILRISKYFLSLYIHM